MMERSRRVAICSRDSEENYKWLTEFMEKRMCKNTKIDVRPVYITHNTAQFHRDVSGYDRAILYHTKKRGRINITNVTDSLYDDELRFLAEKFGKMKVVVVIDDLENSDDDEKRRIKEAQRDLGEHAGDVFLFTEDDKHCTENHLNKIENDPMEKKMRGLKAFIKGSKGAKLSNLKLGAKGSGGRHLGKKQKNKRIKGLNGNRRKNP